jgi:hypothetical protein
MSLLSSAEVKNFLMILMAFRLLLDLITAWFTCSHQFSLESNISPCTFIELLQIMIDIFQPYSYWGHIKPVEQTHFSFCHCWLSHFMISASNAYMSSMRPVRLLPHLRKNESLANAHNFPTSNTGNVNIALETVLRLNLVRCQVEDHRLGLICLKKIQLF